MWFNLLLLLRKNTKFSREKKGYKLISVKLFYIIIQSKTNNKFDDFYKIILKVVPTKISENF